MDDALSSSMEDYLEAILHITEQQKVARPKDISKEMGVTAPSVTKALQWLSKHSLVNYVPFGLVTLTKTGERVARRVARRHEVLHDFLVQVLAVDEKSAQEAACKMEHAISGDILERLIKYLEFIEMCPQGGTQWIEGLGYRCSQGRDLGVCESCIETCLEDVRQKKKVLGEGVKQVTLAEMGKGDRGRIVKVRSKSRACRQIVEMGIEPGSILEVEQVTPAEETMEIKVKGYHIALLEEDAAHIMVAPL